MIKTQYPIIAESQAAGFGPISANGDEAFVNVGIEGTSRKTAYYGYLMRRESSGWKINGVVEIKRKRNPSNAPKEVSTKV